MGGKRVFQSLTLVGRNKIDVEVNCSNVILIMRGTINLESKREREREKADARVESEVYESSYVQRRDIFITVQTDLRLPLIQILFILSSLTHSLSLSLSLFIKYFLLSSLSSLSSTFLLPTISSKADDFHELFALTLDAGASLITLTLCVCPILFHLRFLASHSLPHIFRPS